MAPVLRCEVEQGCEFRETHQPGRRDDKYTHILSNDAALQLNTTLLAAKSMNKSRLIRTDQFQTKCTWCKSCQVRCGELYAFLSLSAAPPAFRVFPLSSWIPSSLGIFVAPDSVSKIFSPVSSDIFSRAGYRHCACMSFFLSCLLTSWTFIRFLCRSGG